MACPWAYLCFVWRGAKSEGLRVEEKREKASRRLAVATGCAKPKITKASLTGGVILINNGYTVAFGAWSQDATAQPWRIIPTDN